MRTPAAPSRVRTSRGLTWSQPVMTPPTPAWYVKGCCPGSFAYDRRDPRRVYTRQTIAVDSTGHAGGAWTARRMRDTACFRMDSLFASDGKRMVWSVCFPPAPLTFVDQNFFIVSSTTPVACTVTVSALATAGPLPAFTVCEAGEENGQRAVGTQ